MALIECHECKAKISGEAKTCPQCGAGPKKEPSRLKIALVGFVGIAIIGSIFDAGKTTSTAASEPPRPTFDECVNKGVDYFKSIGSFPFLSTGEDAKVVAKRRCTNTRTAF